MCELRVFVCVDGMFVFVNCAYLCVEGMFVCV